MVTAKGFNGEVISVAGTVVKVEIEGDSAEVLVAGTLSEQLLKFVTGAPASNVR